jgi:hypothetical protein
LTSDGLYIFVCDAGVSPIKKVSIDSGTVTVITTENPSEGAAALDVTGLILQSPSGITLLPQEPRMMIEISGSTMDYVYGLRILFDDGDSLDYKLGRSSASIGETINTNFSQRRRMY